MPELPEVATIVNELSQEIVGKTIQDITVRLEKIVKGVVAAVIGQRVVAVERRAKLIIIRLTRDNLVIHLKMTGQLFFLPPGQEATVTGERENQFTHVVFHFSDGSRLLFNDVRQFGYIKVVKGEELTRLLTEDYGIEPTDSQFTTERLSSIVRAHPTMRLKPLLLDQTIIAGIGNIYADEALWEARLHPLTRAGALSEEEVARLREAIVKVIAEAVTLKGTSMDMYRRTTGEKGEYEFHRRVYRREGQPCPRCGTPIKRITLGGRGTHFCPHCQVQKP